MVQTRIEQISRLTPAQGGLLLEAVRRHGDGTEINQSILGLRGPLRPALLREAWRAVGRHHPVLRSSIHYQQLDAPVQVVRPGFDPPWRELDWRGGILRLSRSKLDALLAEDRRTPFELSRAPLLRLTLVRAEEELSWLVCSAHAVLLDGWSHSMVLAETFQSYHRLVAGESLALPPARPFWEYTAWLNRRDTAEAERYWRQRLAGFAPLPPLGDKAAGPEATVHAEVTVRLPDPRGTALTALARQCRVTPATVAYAAWTVLLTWYTGRDDVAFGSIVSGRDPAFDRVETVAGLFMSNQPVRATVPAGRTVREWLGQLQDDLVAARRFSHVPLATAHRASGLPLDAPLVESVVDVYNYPVQRRRAEGFGGVRVTDATQRETPQYPLCLVGTAGEPGWRLTLQYHTDRFSGRLATRLAELLAAVLAALAERPGRRLEDLPRPPSAPVLAGPPAAGEAASAPEDAAGSPPAAGEAAAGQLVDVVAAIWAQVLDLPAGGRPGPTDNFFASGGYSLPAIRLLTRLRSTVGVDFEVADLFAEPSPAGIARRVQAQLAGGGPEPAAGPTPRTDPEAPVPASFGQERLWFVHQLTERGPGNIAVLTWRFPCALDPVALRAAVAGLLARHEVLRTFLRDRDGTLVQEVQSSLDPPLSCEDLSDLPIEQAEPAAREILEEEAERRFDLSGESPVRFRMLKLRADDTVLGIFLHHVAYDGWSAGVLARELPELYRAARAGVAPELPPLPLQYADFSLWQRQRFTDAPPPGLVEYWRTQLAGAPPLLRLAPAAGAAGDGQAGTGGWLTRDGSAALAEAVRELAVAEAVTPYMLALAAYGILLARHSNQDDIIVGSPVDDREHPALEPLIGLFVNTHVLRLPLAGTPTFRELLGRVRGVCLGALAHRAMPFEKLVSVLSPDRSANHMPLVQVGFSFVNGPVAPVELAGATATGFPIRRRDTRFELTTELYLAPGAARVTVNYAEDIYRREFIARLAEEYLDILQAAVADPERPVVTGAGPGGGAGDQAPAGPVPHGASRELLRSLRPR